MSKHAVPTVVRTYLEHTIVETRKKGEGEVERPCERVAHRNGKNSSAAPVIAATGT